MESPARGRAFLKGALPNVVVLVALVALAYAGHRTGWKLGRFSELWRGGATPPKEDWCQAHNVPDSRCLACHPALGGNDAKDWCKEHGVPESRCTLCHPEILTKGQAADWCKEHGVPESSCTLCHPDLAVVSPAPASAHPKVVTDPSVKKDPAACQTHQVRIQFASARAVTKAGVELAAVEARPIAATVAANGELSYDLTRVARLSPRVPGTVFRVEKEVGDKVKKGDLLALVEAPEVGRAKGDLLQAHAALELRGKVLERVQASAASGLRTQAELDEARAAAREARLRLLGAQQALANLGLPVKLDDLAPLADEALVERLRLLGLPASAVESLGRETTTASLLPITAPQDGELVVRDAVAGEVIEPSRTLFVVADLSRLWLNLDLRLEDVHRVKVGQTVSFTPDANAEGAVRGKLSWIGTTVDEKTRTVKVRALVSSSPGALRAGTFGSARIVVRESPAAPTVPLDAVHWEGCCHVVFVRLTDDIFQTRKVRLGAKAAGLAEVLVGLVPGEVVAAHGSHVLKSELLKSNLGAGCCD